MARRAALNKLLLNFLQLGGPLVIYKFLSEPSRKSLDANVNISFIIYRTLQVIIF